MPRYEADAIDVWTPQKDILSNQHRHLNCTLKIFILSGNEHVEVLPKGRFQETTSRKTIIHHKLIIFFPSVNIQGFKDFQEPLV